MHTEQFFWPPRNVDADLLLAGDADAKVEGMHELTWTFHCEKERSVTARRVPASIESYAYVINEANR